MLRGLRRFRPSPALVVASVALLVSLGGVGYAAARLPRNSVGTAQLRNNAVNSAKIKNHSLKSADLARNTVRQGPPGATGPTGPTGATGPQGATGPPGASGLGIGGSCSGGGAIKAVASTGAVSCQPAATDSTDGYLSATDHASFGAARTFTFSSPAIAHESFGSLANTVISTTPTITVPGNLHELFVLWEGEWKGGSSAAPSTTDCWLGLDPGPGFTSIPTGASRHSTSTGGYADFVVSALFAVTPGQHKIGLACENDTGGASIGNANLTVIATE